MNKLFINNNAMIDITRALYVGFPAWPGDPPYEATLCTSIDRGDKINVHNLSLSTHTGTHVDAPWHYDPNGPQLHEVPLTTWIGTCLVVEIKGQISIDSSLIDNVSLEGISKLLVRTGQPNSWDVFPADWMSVDPKLPAFLADQGITLLGTDAPSVDSLGSTELLAHQAFAQAGVCILEGLALEHVNPGRYQLMCLPLRLLNADGAPARVLLLPET